MSIKCGWASIDERGKARGGQVGDQTGKEVKTGSWYNFGQTEILRWKNREYARKYANIIEYWCNSNYVGYDQNQRTTLGIKCKSNNWDYKLNSAVETDCSRMAGEGVNCTLKKEIIPLSATFYTGNLGEKLLSTGYFTRLTGSKYCNNDSNLMIGDIINNPAKHVIIALESGSNIKNGWKKELNIWHYYIDNEKVKDSWQKDSKGWCYLNSKGNLSKNSWVKWNNDWYYMNSSGYMVSNTWQKGNTGWYYLGNDGKMVVSKWIKWDNSWYYLNSDGRMASNQWQKDSVGWCWLLSNGRMAKDIWIKDKDVWYYIKPSGYMASNEWIKYKDYWYWLTSSGKMAKDFWLNWKRNWYYLDSDGKMVTGIKVIKDVKYIFEKDGRLIESTK